MELESERIAPRTTACKGCPRVQSKSFDFQSRSRGNHIQIHFWHDEQWQFGNRLLTHNNISFCWNARDSLLHYYWAYSSSRCCRRRWWSISSWRLHSPSAATCHFVSSCFRNCRLCVLTSTIRRLRSSLIQLALSVLSTFAFGLHVASHFLKAFDGGPGIFQLEKKSQKACKIRIVGAPPGEAPIMS